MASPESAAPAAPAAAVVGSPMNMNTLTAPCVTSPCEDHSRCERAAELAAAIGMAPGGKPPSTRIVQMVAGLHHTAAIGEDGIVLVWGAGSRLGLGPQSDHTTPQRMTTLAHLEVRRLATGDRHTLAIGHPPASDSREDVGLYTWGANLLCQCGVGDTVDHLEPVIVEGTDTACDGHRLVQVSAGATHTLALADDGDVLCWGGNYFGQLGDGLHGDKSKPSIIKGLDQVNVAEVVCGGTCSFALTDDGGVFSWGENYYGQLGLGHTQPQASPTRVSGLWEHKIIKIATGRYHALALCNEGRVWSWGNNKYGQLGRGEDGLRLRDDSEPTRVVGLDKVLTVDLECGGYHNLLLTDDGSVLAWGNNFYGQLGLGRRGRRDEPTAVQGLAKYTVIRLVCGEHHSFAIAKDASVLAWGCNDAGQLGIGSYRDTNVPKLVSGVEGGVLIGHEAAIVSRKANARLLTNGEAGGDKANALPDGDVTIGSGDTSIIGDEKPSPAPGAQLGANGSFVGGPDMNALAALANALNLSGNNRALGSPAGPWNGPGGWLGGGGAEVRVHDLREALRALGLEEYVSVLQGAGVDIDTVGLLDDDDLAELGIPLGPRKRLIMGLKQMRYEGRDPPPSLVAAPASDADDAQMRDDIVAFLYASGKPQLAKAASSLVETAGRVKKIEAEAAEARERRGGLMAGVITGDGNTEPDLESVSRADLVWMITELRKMLHEAEEQIAALRARLDAESVARGKSHKREQTLKDELTRVLSLLSSLGVDTSIDTVEGSFGSPGSAGGGAGERQRRRLRRKKKNAEDEDKESSVDWKEAVAEEDAAFKTLKSRRWSAAVPPTQMPAQYSGGAAGGDIGEGDEF